MPKADWSSPNCDKILQDMENEFIRITCQSSEHNSSVAMGYNQLELMRASYPSLVGPPQLKKGDYVLATKYDDGSPCDHFCVGFFLGYTDHKPRRLDIVDGKGNLFRGNGFRRAEVITEEEGRKLLAIFPEIGDRPGPSLWWHLGKIRGVVDPPDPCSFHHIDPSL